MLRIILQTAFYVAEQVEGKCLDSMKACLYLRQSLGKERVLLQSDWGNCSWVQEVANTGINLI